MLYVLAGSYHQYTHWIRDKRLANGTEVRYIQDERSFRGQRGQRFVSIGTWYEKENVDRLIDMMLVSDFTEMVEGSREPRVIDLIRYFE